ncbi:hypothetical protein M902_1401 [Bacteriovorax sp. BAL6_X]|uniref:RDD family protein n=1 Tax=Bacteriovorax sp. BAL6_X TaxID=1201290 RepID=UPI0003867605|nr:RDD family protein [Bacteriovorax sp. BAL6_X]EPZ50498.1 hypothetical protein M902_1401 [Bacteriovorax sp. BAL6_X]
MNLESQNSKKPIRLNDLEDFDDFGIEDIPFKPINEGLGFHHGKASKEVLKSARVEVTPSQSHVNNFNKVLGREKEMSVPSELEAFYRKGTESEIPKVNREIEIKNKSQDVSITRRFTSYVIDMSVSLVIFAVTLAAMFLVSGLPIESFIEITLLNSNYRFLIALFVLIHIIYRITSVYRPTLGQYICGLKPKLSNEAAFNTIIERTLFEFISIPLLGLPYILGLDKKFFGNSLKKSK